MRNKISFFTYKLLMHIEHLPHLATANQFYVELILFEYISHSPFKFRMLYAIAHRYSKVC